MGEASGKHGQVTTFGIDSRRPGICVRTSLIPNLRSAEAMMDSKGSDRRHFLKQSVAAAGVGLAGAAALSSKKPAQAQGEVKSTHIHDEPPRRGARYTIDLMTHYTPLQDY